MRWIHLQMLLNLERIHLAPSSCINTIKLIYGIQICKCQNAIGMCGGGACERQKRNTRSMQLGICIDFVAFLCTAAAFRCTLHTGALIALGFCYISFVTLKFCYKYEKAATSKKTFKTGHKLR